jgi:hypothetical protein
MTVVTRPAPTAPAGDPDALFEEARRRARRRRLGYAAAGLLLVVASLAVVTAIRHGGGAERSGAGPAAVAPPAKLRIARGPFMGVSCAAPNIVTCDRVRIGLRLRQRAVAVRARIGVRSVALVRADPAGYSWDGAFQPAGLKDAGSPLAVSPEPGHSPDYWSGVTPVLAPVRVTARLANGRAAAATARVPLSPGWG